MTCSRLREVIQIIRFGFVAKHAMNSAAAKSVNAHKEPILIQHSSCDADEVTGA